MSGQQRHPKPNSEPLRKWREARYPFWPATPIAIASGGACSAALLFDREALRIEARAERRRLKETRTCFALCARRVPNVRATDVQDPSHTDKTPSFFVLKPARSPLPTFRGTSKFAPRRRYRVAHLP